MFTAYDILVGRVVDRRTRDALAQRPRNAGISTALILSLSKGEGARRRHLPPVGRLTPRISSPPARWLNRVVPRLRRLFVRLP